MRIPDNDVYKASREPVTILGYVIGSYVAPDVDEDDEDEGGGSDLENQTFWGFIPSDVLDEVLPDEWLENIRQWVAKNTNSKEGPSWHLTINHSTGSIKLYNDLLLISEQDESYEPFDESVDGDQMQWLELLKACANGSFDDDEEDDE
jgi:hypothetical protein